MQVMKQYILAKELKQYRSTEKGKNVISFKFTHLCDNC